MRTTLCPGPLVGQLQLRGRAEALTPEIKAAAAEHKTAVLALLLATAFPGETDVGEGEPDEQWDEAETGESFRHDHDWQDWRLEWLLEVGTLFLRMRRCQDSEVLSRLRPLTEVTPRSLTEWLALGQRIREAEGELRSQGRLPAYRWPGMRAGDCPCAGTAS
jgi:hypothetical protein